tara:strand:- start:1042 stop:1455 length:414 start_codon:yes stop_codon:yes gene_type:complete
MNDPISWDPSLVKKFSSSNHYKLLNQLRNEVKKYPLNNKKKTSSIMNDDTNLDTLNKSNVKITKNISNTNKSIHSNDLNSNKSTVSFNNATNFSIYNQSINNNVIREKEIILADQIKTSEDTTSPTFKERLNQIEMK